MQHFIFIPASILSNYKHRRILFSESLHPLDGSDTRGSCGQHTRDDKERIGHDSALCRREATEDHRSRAGEYEWWSGSNRRYSPTERNLQERDGDHTQRPSDSIRPGSLDWFVFRGRLTSAELDFIKGDANFRESCNDTGFIFYRWQKNTRETISLDRAR